MEINTCRKHQLTEKEAMLRLSRFLHDLGVFLHFQDHPLLSRLVILQNSWVTKGVYKILDNKEIEQQNGHFSYSQAQAIWNNSVYENACYELLELMNKFGLCCQILNQQPAQYIIPQLLTKEKPSYEWDKEQNLQLAYEYDFLPKGMMSRLMVLLYKYIKDIEKLAWRTGCIFHYENTDAQIEEASDGKKINIRIKGIRAPNLAGIITREIDELNARFKQLKVKKMIPCSCAICKDSETPHFYDYQRLLVRKKKGQPTVECDFSYKHILVQEIMDGVYSLAVKKDKSIKALIRQLNNIQDSINQGFKATDESLAIIQNTSKENTSDIIDWLGVAFKIQEIQELENFIELQQTFQVAKKSNDWETKVKLAIPLINLIGVKLETESKFDLKRYIDNIKEKMLELSIKYGVKGLAP